MTVEHLVVANWGLAGTSSGGAAGYRSQNPWQALKDYMNGRRGGSAAFFAQHGATPVNIDSGGTVWRVDLASIPTTPAGIAIDDFARRLLDELVAQNTSPHADDTITVTYASPTLLGRWVWTP